MRVFLSFPNSEILYKVKQNKRIIYASILSGLILIGITLLQIVWFLKASEIAETNYNKRFNLAMEALKGQLKEYEDEKTLSEIKSYIFQTLYIFDTDTPHLVDFNNNQTQNADINDAGIFKQYEFEYGKKAKKLILYFKPKSRIVQLDINQWLWFSSLFILIIALSIGGFLYLFIKQKRSNEMKTDFVNMLTHEFKTPVATISLISEVLGRIKSNNSAEKIQRYAGILQAEISRLKLLVDKTLQVASFDNKTVKLELAETQLNKLLQESSECISATFEKNKPEIILDFNIKNDTLLADEAHLRNVFINLLDNSCKYCEKQAKITIKSYQENSDLIVQVSDNGVGINRRNLPHIFDKFYRVSTGDVHNIQGSGLGLYYAKQIVEFHNGKINATSSLDKGTNVIIKLPKTN
ncbi:MAG: HAMP domain-containing histidine kinase [Bacteroidales bacterium]|nr:HAMP domain-containing histidine kinase [Bacteroidales bacterium]